MYAAVVFNNSRGFSQRHWNDLTYRNILRFTFMEPFVEGILFGTESLANFHQLSIPPVCTQTLFRHPTFFFTHQTPRLWLHCLSNKPFCLVFFLKAGQPSVKIKERRPDAFTLQTSSKACVCSILFLDSGGGFPLCLL